MKRISFIIILVSFFSKVWAQSLTAVVSGKILNENEQPVAGASIIILGNYQGEVSGEDGSFIIRVPAHKAFALVFSFSGYHDQQKNFFLNSKEKEEVIIQLTPVGQTLTTVEIKDEKERKETGLVRINPKNTLHLPTAAGGVEGLIKTLVGSNNELTSQYSVRGGNYDENLIYINDFEIYRPYLVRSGQQEGLSFINPELTKSIQFYNGGFQAKYGDKISSVLDIQYKKPDKPGGAAYVSLLEQGISLQGISSNKKWTWLAGVRHKTSQSLLSSQETKGNYQPSSSDMQAFLTYRISSKIHMELLAISSASAFSLIPESARKSSAVFTPFFTRNMGLDIQFEGREKDHYQSNLIGLSLVQNPANGMTLKWMVSRYADVEKEHFDIAGAYILGERNTDQDAPEFGSIVNPLGAGLFQNYARNDLDIQVYNFSHKGSHKGGNHFLLWGTALEHSLIRDDLNEWEYLDSAGYSLPFNPDNLHLNKALNSSARLRTNKWTGYLQDNILLGSADKDITLQAGVRFQYNSLNREFLISPRASLSIRPDWEKDIIFKASAGWYSQPPFYRELRRPDGSINTSLKSQKSVQLTAGMDYHLIQKLRPVRLTTELYYKSLWDVVPYDIENLRIRYYANNRAKAYAAGIEARLFTELVKDAESWLSIGISQTKENLADDYYYTYKNAAGETIQNNTVDKIIADSIRHEVGFVRRPSDRLLTMGLFLQDYLSTNKNFKVHLSMIYGSNMSFNIPDNARYRNALIIEPYMRIDLGLSALLLSAASSRRSHSPFAAFENIWASLEVFNLIDKANTVSYQLVKDYANNIFSIPNRLTPRMINFKILARW